MKLKRLTWTKRVIRIICVLTPLIAIYHWSPMHIEHGGKALLMGFSIISWQIGRFIGIMLTTDYDI